jgi:glyceraldehyde-3-phosphate dehydrogenase/erythrose-4-phosphate dehydrogenase
MKTAVEWLVDKLMKGEFINDTESLIDQAKEMEKEQMIEFAKYTSVIDTERSYMNKVIDFYFSSEDRDKILIQKMDEEDSESLSNVAVSKD